jgi:hypothetical protein
MKVIYRCVARASLFLGCLSLAGCQFKETVEVINSLDNAIIVHITDGAGRYEVQATIPANGRKEIFFSGVAPQGTVPAIVVNSGDGRWIGRKPVLFADPAGVYSRAEEGKKAKSFLLVSSKGLFFIPVKYVQDWSSHLREIESR